MSISIQIYVFIMGYSEGVFAYFSVVYWIVKFATDMYSRQARCWHTATMIRKLLKSVTNLSLLM